MANAGTTRSRGVFGFFDEMSEGVRRQGNVIFALVFKEFLANSAGRSGLSLFWVLAEPAVFSLSMAAIWYVLRRQSMDGIPVAEFLLISMLPYLIVQNSILGISKSITRNESFYTFQQVKPIDALLARFTLDVTLLILGACGAMALLYWFFGQWLYLDRIDHAVGELAVAAVLGLGVALLVGTYGTLHPVVYIIVGLPMRGLMILSGVIISPADLPLEVQVYIAWNPLACLIDYFRADLFHTPHFAGSSMTFVVLVALCMLFLGLVAYYPNRHRLAANR